MISLLFTLLACDSGTPAAPEASGPVAPLVALPPGSTGSAPTSAPAAASGEVLSGSVVEAIPAGSYTYVRVKPASGAEFWAASTGAAPAVGAEARISTHLPMKNFHSETLNRDFELVYFVESFDGAGPPAAAAGLPSGHPSVAEPADAGASSTADVNVAAPVAVTGPPAGAKTVGEVWGARKELAGREVTVSGKVVKFTRGVLGKNWAHIQDGSGAPGTNDLTVTTKGEAVVGDSVVATGVVAIDRDFGAGYTYEVIVTDASLSVQK